MTTNPTFNVVADFNLAYQTHITMLDGILSYVKTHASWNLALVTGRRDEPKRFNPNEVDGVFLDFTDSRMPNWMRNLDFTKIPVTFISDSSAPNLPCCRIYCDNVPIAKTAAQHLLSKHCEAYVFVHSAGQSWSDERGRLFAQMVKDGGGRFLWRTSNRKTLPRLIAETPKPLGVFAATDILARTTLDACRIAGCQVPDEVLIVGVDNDTMLCETSNTTISSIPQSSRDAGYRAAEIMDLAMRGEIDIQKLPDVSYTGNTVVERLSSARSFAYDALVRRCRETLASEFASPIRIADLAKHFRVSRRTLETHFRDVTGTTIADEICRLRIERAKHLLATTSDAQDKIAAACGFYNASHLSATFRSRLGKRPSAFRLSR